MIETFDGAIQFLRQVQDNLPESSPDRAKLELVIEFIDGEVRETMADAVQLIIEDQLRIDQLIRMLRPVQETHYVA